MEHTAAADPPAIGDYGVIGDCRTIALVSREASVDWWCQPRFDAPSVFARILDSELGGAFHLEARGLAAAGRRYVPHTAILETSLTAAGGRLVVTDFAALEGRGDALGPQPFARQKLVRIVRCAAGRIELSLVARPRPGYASVQRPRFVLAGPERQRRRTVEFRAAGRTIQLAATRAWGALSGGEARLRITLEAGDEVGVAIDYGPGDMAGEGVEHGGGHHHEPVELALLHAWERDTHAFWTGWAKVSTYAGPYRDAVERSAITLKLLTYHPTGALVAAGTTSLPETIGGERNWDYRFTWLRDASFTLFALHTLGYRAESDAFMSWLARICVEVADPLVLYRVDGAVANRERTLPHLAGHRGSRPVRIGNGAAWQRQLDIYGEVLDAAYLDARAGNEVTDRGVGAASPPWPTWPRAAGDSPTPRSGRCAAATATSRTRRSCAGWRSTARSGWRRSSVVPTRSAPGSSAGDPPRPGSADASWHAGAAPTGPSSSRSVSTSSTRRRSPSRSSASSPATRRR